MVTLESNIYNKTSDGQIILGATIIIYNSEENEVKRISVVDESELNELRSQLDVIDNTYIKFADGSTLEGRSIDNILSNSSKDVVINATKLNGVAGANYSQIDHTHDDRYFTEDEITSQLSQKSNTNHGHGWSTVPTTSYSILRVNPTLRLAFFKYYRENYTGFKKGDTYYKLETIPGGYRPLVATHVMTGSNTQWGVIDNDGAVNIARSGAADKATVHFETFYIY